MCCVVCKTRRSLSRLRLRLLRDRSRGSSATPAHVQSTETFPPLFLGVGGKVTREQTTYRKADC
eukprot:6292362-Amphidinium_carterae.1